MIVVVTGMVGIDKKSYLQEVCSLAQKNGKEVVLCNVGDMMYAEAPDVPAGKILDISLKRLHSLRRSVFKDIIARSEKAENVIVNTHATFRWRHGLFPAVDFDQMRQLGADMYVCLIDGIVALHSRLCAEHAVEHSLKDLLVWREEEIIGTEMLAKGVNDKASLYCMARGSERSTAESFYRLVFEPWVKKAYLSFPMTHVSDDGATRSQIDAFREEMKRYFVCFDPADLEESYLPGCAAEALAQGRQYIEVEALGRTVRLEVEQVRHIERDINSQIYARDFMLIDQSDMIISYIPALPGGRAAISSGVERELQHAHEAAKQVFVIWEARYPPSVFVGQTATKVFPGVAEAVSFFVEQGYIKDER